MKNTLKRTLTVLLALMLVWAACSVATFAKDYDGTITASAATAKPGENVDVTITLGEHPGLVSLQIEVGYDADALTLTGVTDAGNLSTFEVDTENLTPNPFTLTWNGDLEKKNITYNGVIATLTFKVKEDADLGDQVITIRSFDAMNYDMDDVFFNDVNGKVTVTHDHTWADEWSKDETNHWKVCTACDAKDGVAAHTFTTREENRVEPADCTTPGSYDLVTYCSVCGYVKSTENNTIEAPGHSWAAAWTTDANQHWHVCTVCNAIDTKADHTASEAVKENGTDATCTTDGSYDLVTYCSVCSREMDKEHKTINKLGHDLIEEAKDEYKVSDADCTNAAKYAKHCSRCDFVSEEEFFYSGEPKGHTWSTEWTTDGNAHWLKCTVCGADNVESYANHSFEETKVIDKPATCGEPGEYHMADKCTICGFEKNPSGTKYDPPTEKHIWKETWESDASDHWHICSVCGNADKASYAEHTKGDEIIDKEPTTEAEGAKHAECTVCGYIMQETIAKLKTYDVTDGNKAVFKKGAKSGVKVTTKVPANGTANIEVKVNGAVVDPANYELTGDSDVTVTLKPEYLETLAKGEYKLEVSDGVGVATSTFTVEEVKAAEDKSPKTGNPVLFWVLLALLANAVLVGSTVYRKKVR